MKKLLTLMAVVACTAAVAQTPPAGSGSRPSRPSVPLAPSHASTPGSDPTWQGADAVPGAAAGSGSRDAMGASAAGGPGNGGPAASGGPGTGTPPTRGLSGDNPSVGAAPARGALMTGASMAGVTSNTMLGNSGSSLATMPSAMSQSTLGAGTETACPPGSFNTGLGCKAYPRAPARAPATGSSTR